MIKPGMTFLHSLIAAENLIAALMESPEYLLTIKPNNEGVINITLDDALQAVRETKEVWKDVINIDG